MRDTTQTGEAFQHPTDACDASASINHNTAPTNTMNTETTNLKGTEDMTTTSTLVQGTTVTAIVESKNQHGASLSVDGEPAFLPVTNLGDTPIAELTKGSEVAVTVVDTTGAKPRVAIATTGATTESSEEPAEVISAEEPAAVVTAEETSDEPEADLSTSIANLAAAWGASVKVDTGKRGVSSKPAKKAVRKVAPVVTAPVVAEAAAAAVVEEKTEVVEPVAAVEPVTPVEIVADSPKVAYLKSLKVGDSVKATVKFKKDFGAFMTVGGVGFGLLHVSEMPGDKPEQRKAYLDGLRYKQEVTCQVVNIDLKEERLGLSLVAGEKENFFAGLKVGSLIEGTVAGTKEIGAFINLGVTTGFLHVSEVDGDRREVRDQTLASFKKGDKLELVIVDVNREKQEVRLSQRRLALATVSEGSQVSGTFVHVRNNVVVLDLDFGGRGFLAKKGGKRYEFGETVTATVKSVDVARGSVELV